MRVQSAVIAAGLALSTLVIAQERQTLQDEYAVYELLAPDTAAFRTTYEVSATTPGATMFFDRIGPGLQSAPPALSAGDGVVDLMTGAPLEVAQIDGAQAKSRGLAEADASAAYL